MVRVASAPLSKASYKARFSPARCNCHRPSDTSIASNATVTSVVNGRGAKMREPTLMGPYTMGPSQRRRAAMEFKYLVIAILVLILISLGKALFHLSSSREPGNSAKMVKALAWRIGLSVLLFVLLLIGYTQGWIEPQHLR